MRTIVSFVRSPLRSVHDKIPFARPPVFVRLLHGIVRPVVRPSVSMISFLCSFLPSLVSVDLPPFLR